MYVCIIYKCLHDFLTFVGLGWTPEQGAITTIKCAVDPALNFQQAIFYTSNTLPEQTTDTVR